MEPTVSTLSSQQAADALQDVQRTQHRVSVRRGYGYSGPHFLLWGIIWALGYGTSGLWPQYAGPVWLALDAIGIIGGFLIVRATPERGAKSQESWKYLGAAVAITAFLAATYLVMAPRSGAQFGAFPPLLGALFYMLVGLWRGVRWTVVGIVLGVLTVVGFALFLPYFMLWMAALGGGTLILTGVWMRAG